LVGNLLFTDNSFDIGATGATRLRSLFAATDLNVQRSALGTTTDDAAILSNTTAAALGAQQVAPALRFQGFGWGTTAGTSQACDWRVWTYANQGAVPSLAFSIGSSLNGAAFPANGAAEFTLFATTGGVYLQGSLYVGAAQVLGWNGRSMFRSPSDGVITAMNAGQTDFTRLNFGGTTSSFPAIARATTVLSCVLADGTGAAQLTCGKAAIGITATTGLEVKNTTAAAIGVQQWSPALQLTGSAWSTTSGQAFPAAWMVYTTAVQGSTPSALLMLFQQALAL
jgi:hypothetical protein